MTKGQRREVAAAAAAMQVVHALSLADFEKLPGSMLDKFFSHDLFHAEVATAEFPLNLGGK